MTLIAALGESSDWDRPFFKRLARNDTGQATGHQAGMVVPKDLWEFLPFLDKGDTSALNPTTEEYVRGDLYLGEEYLDSRWLRYQLQTWGGTRSPEARITDGFGLLWQKAGEGDILVFQRSAKELSHFKLTLWEKGTEGFQAIEKLAEGRRWGPLSASLLPAQKSSFQAAKKEIDQQRNTPFRAQGNEVERRASSGNRIVRDAVFRELVKREYGHSCAVTGIRLQTPDRLYEVEAAHIVPLKSGGTDDLRNGIALCQSLHWAFDQGLFGVSTERKVYIPRRVKETGAHRFLLELDGGKIAEAKNEPCRAHPEAFAWHMGQIVRRWEV
jgi:putative restriction endonuclease